MDGLIIELWNGEIAPCEHCGAHDVRSNGLHVSMGVCRDNLLKELTPGQTEQFQKYISLSQDFLIRSMELAFQDGFRLGSRLIMDTLK